ncbi:MULTISPECIES: site-specific integrase [Aeromonas]|uniref:Site-specific integrase n=1 Tax=Aeromonas caviae TaxID=648 RepID=A0A7T3X102_AERCA|nr:MULTISPECIES: site-specific integrase [Aeromonas]QQA60038.1 site-specific integrase [Aeromonas caviae]
MYKLEIIVFENGERYPILMGSDGMPHFLATLWVTAKLRSSMAVNTISNRLRTLKWFFQWEEKESRELFLEFQQGLFLSQVDIDNIKEHLSLDISHINGLSNKKSRSNVIDIGITPKLIQVTPSVARNNIYNRLTVIAEYLKFIATIAVQNKTNHFFTSAIEKMTHDILALRPKGKGKKTISNVDGKNIPDGLIDEFMSVAHFEHPKNPFKDLSTKKRNHLMFVLLYELGIRRGELLSLTMGENLDILGSNKYVTIRRLHDDKHDPRKRQPVAKTRERKLQLTNYTAALIDDYIINIRAKTPNSGKHPYLFVTHRKGPTQGQPISISTFDTIIVPAMKAVDERFKAIHPHYFRHNWNLNFSRLVDNNNELATDPKNKRTRVEPSEEAKKRMHQMGHSSESSAEPYMVRHIREKTNKIILEEQEKFKQKLASLDSYKEE